MKSSGKKAAPVLSERLLMLAEMVTPGNRLADVGCDHGFLDIYLVQKGICPGALAMDVRQGPLAGAEEHIREYGLGDYIEVRLSDGLARCGAGEADTLVCAGMGGRLIEKILREGMDRAKELKEVILQPQSEIPEFRLFLRSAGFRIVEENAVFEEGKYYFAMKAVYGGDTFRETEQVEMLSQKGEALHGGNLESNFICRQRLYDLYGEHLLLRGHPVLLQYLEQRLVYLERLSAFMTGAGTEKAEKRLEEIRRERRELEQGIRFLKGKAGQI